MGKGSRPPIDAPVSHDDILKAVGARLREARLKAGLTQAQLGLKADVKQSYIFELESGGKNLSLRTLARMADVFEMDIRELLPETRPGPPSAMSLSLLQAAFERVASLLSDRQFQDAKLQAQQTELISIMKSFTGLGLSFEGKTEPPQGTPVETAPSLEARLPQHLGDDPSQN